MCIIWMLDGIVFVFHVHIRVKFTISFLIFWIDNLSFIAHDNLLSLTIIALGLSPLTPSSVYFMKFGTPVISGHIFSTVTASR